MASFLDESDIERSLLEQFREIGYETAPGMIVGMSRRICVDLYKEIVELRPDWHDADDDKGSIKIVMTGSASDPRDWQQHIRPKAGREKIAKRFKDVTDPLKLVIVRDMWRVPSGWCRSASSRRPTGKATPPSSSRPRRWRI